MRKLCVRCGKPATAKELCRKHYDMQRNESKLAAVGLVVVHRPEFVGTPEEVEVAKRVYRKNGRKKANQKRWEKIKTTPELMKERKEKRKIWFHDAKYKEARKERERKYSGKHRDYVRNKYNSDPEFRQKRRNAGHNYRARKFYAPSDGTVRLFRMANRCFYCSREVRRYRWLRADSAVMDHVIPLGLGGSNSITNVVTACHACNSSKGGLHPLEWGRLDVRKYIRLRLLMSLMKDYAARNGIEVS